MTFISHKILLCFVFCVFIKTFAAEEDVASTKKPSSEEALPVQQLSTEAIAAAPAAQSPTSSAPPSQPSSSVAASAPPSFLGYNDNPNRRVITYDQRQEGKYNIRADLENFMIVVVPSSPSAGLSLLDLLTRSNLRQKQQQQLQQKSKYHKKYVRPGAIAAAASTTDEEEKQQQKSTEEQQYIEGRTPYHVDISSLEPKTPINLGTGSASSRTMRLITESQPIETLRLQTVPQGNSPLYPTFSYSDDFSNNNVILFRNKKSLTDDSSYQSEVNRNSVASSETNESDYTDVSSSFDSLEMAEPYGAAATIVDDGANNGWKLTLLGGGVEDCGPDRRRDSYGICQFYLSN